MIEIWCVIVLDLLLKDPEWLYHPVRFIGLLITHGEGLVRQWFGQTGTRMGGVLLVMAVLALILGLYTALTNLLALVHLDLSDLFDLYLAYALLAAGSLMQEGRRIRSILAEGDLAKARKQLSYLVSRDTESLEEKDLIRGAVETLSENITDGIVSPLFYLALFGVEGMLAFKIISTFDSMIGYKNERYLHLGWFAAKVDDVLNYVPARLAALLVVIAAALVGEKPLSAVKVFYRDHRKHASPNSACTESAVAGALGISIGGPSVYFGKLVSKPTIGDGPFAENGDILLRVNRLVMMVTLLMGACLSVYFWKRGLYVRF